MISLPSFETCFLIFNATVGGSSDPTLIEIGLSVLRVENSVDLRRHEIFTYDVKTIDNRVSKTKSFKIPAYQIATTLSIAFASELLAARAEKSQESYNGLDSLT